MSRNAATYAVECAQTIIVLVAVGVVLLLAPATASSAQAVLRFEKEIGVGWRDGTYGWMGLVSFSPDGTMVASDGPATSKDVSNDLTMWSFPEGRLIKRISAKVQSISHDWKYYATESGVTEIETGRRVISLGKNQYASYTFSPDSRYVVESGARRNYAIRVLDLATGKQVGAFGKNETSGIAISPDDKTLASGYWDLVVLRNLSTGERLGALRGFKDYAAGLSFSPDGKLLAVTTLEGLQIWDLESDTRIGSLDIYNAGSSDPVFSPDGRFVAVGTYGNGTAWLVDVISRRILEHAKVSDMGCGSVAFSPDGRFLITPSTGGLIKWPYDRGGTIRVFKVTP
jgi:WD40 repeat protein